MPKYTYTMLSIKLVDSDDTITEGEVWYHLESTSFLRMSEEIKQEQTYCSLHISLGKMGIVSWVVLCQFVCAKLYQTITLSTGLCHLYFVVYSIQKTYGRSFLYENKWHQMVLYFYIHLLNFYKAIAVAVERKFKTLAQLIWVY